MHEPATEDQVIFFKNATVIRQIKMTYDVITNRKNGIAGIYNCTKNVFICEGFE